MSNKLVKNNSEKRKVTEKQKRILFVSSLTILLLSFFAVWITVFRTSNEFREKMETMVLGVDYFREDVVITNKRVESEHSVSDNYFFYYKNGKVHEYDKRMQVPGTVYREYEIGDTITAYTTNHREYSYEKYGILPKEDFKNNELRKANGVLLGIGILVLIFLRVLDRK